MTTEVKQYSVIEVAIENCGQYVYAHSKDIPGLHIAGSTLDELLPKMEDAIKALYRLNLGLEVTDVTLALDPSFSPRVPELEVVENVRKYVLSAGSPASMRGAVTCPA